jgi:beta-N-acetylhexosaminidase
MLAKDQPGEENSSEFSQNKEDYQQISRQPAKRPSAARQNFKEQVAFPTSQTWTSSGQSAGPKKTPSRPMPALVYTAQQNQNEPWKNYEHSSDEPWRNHEQSPVQPTPPPATPPLSTPIRNEQPRRPPVLSEESKMLPAVFRKRKRMIIPVLVASMLVVMAILVAGAALLSQRWLAGGQLSPTQQSFNGKVGPFTNAPLTAQQIEDLRHLASHLKYKQLASMYVSQMTLDEEIGQIIMIEYGDEYYSADLNNMIAKLHAGGVIMYEFQMNTFNQTRNDIAQMQKNAQIPLLVAADEEGGCCVHRLSNIYGPRMGPTDIWRTGNPAIATREGKKVGHDLISLGLNVNLAPSVDVELRPGPQSTRTFGHTVDDVIKFGSAYIKAMQGEGVTACIKHFPGMGDAAVDPHKSLPIINRTKDQIYSVELAPYRYFFGSKDALEHVDMIMPTNILVPSIDPNVVAELSPKFMTDILRKEMGFDGVSITDALYMQGIMVNGKPVSMDEAGILALNAGNDMLLGPTGTAQTLSMINAIKLALQSGRISKARLDEAATRVITLKMQRGIMPATVPLR